MAKDIHLRPDEFVSYRGQNWKILHVESVDRVLATRLSDWQHDFLPVAELAQPIWGNDDKNALNVTLARESVEGTSISRNARQIINRSIRQPAKNLTIKQNKKYQDAVKEFIAIQKIIKAPRMRRSTLIAELCAKFDISIATAYRHINLVKWHGTPEVILGSIRADKGTPRLSASVLEVVKDHLKKFRFVETPKTLPKILVLVNGALRKNGLKEICLATLRNYEQETPLKGKLELQGRKKEAKDRFGSKVGQLPDSDYPLAIVQIDHTPAQVCLVDEIDRQPIGDAWLTLVIDTYSRMVLGFFLSFDPPSTLSAGLAMAHAFLPKEEYLRNQRVIGEWPCWGFPDIIYVDNAAELNGRMMHEARSTYRFDLRDRPVGSPNFGGHVESAFKTFMYEFKSLPGTKFSNPMERGEYDSEGRAIFTIAEFEAFFTEFLVNDYHLNEHTGKGMSKLAPLQKWKKGMLEGDVMPPTGLPDKPGDPLALRISLLPFEKRTIRNGVIEIFSEQYHNPALTLISDSINLNRPLSDRLYEVRYDPRDISKIWLLNTDTGNYLDLAFTDLRKGSISLWEHNARKKRIGNPTDEFKDRQYESMQKREGMKESAAKRTRQTRLAAEKERRRASGAIITPPPRPAKHVAPPTTKKPLNPERIKALREKVRPATVDPSIKRETPDDA